MNIDNINIKKILICQLRQIGDVILSTPFISILKKKYPDSKIDFFTEKKCAPVLQNNPDLDNIFELNKKKSTLEHFKLYKTLAQNQYDLIVDFQQLPRCRMVMLLSILNNFGNDHKQIRLSFPPPWYNRPLYTNWGPKPQGHVLQIKGSLLQPLGLAWQGEKPCIKITPQEDRQAKNLLQKLDFDATRHRLISLAPTHKSITRRWPAEYYGQMIKLAVQSNPELRFLLFYGPGEKETISKVIESAQSPKHCLLPEKMLSLREMAAVMAKAELHIGNCSAPRHLAVAADIPSLTILGCENKGWTFPSSKHSHISLDLDCQPCKKSQCPYGHLKCLKELKPQIVTSSLLKALTYK